MRPDNQIQTFETPKPVLKTETPPLTGLTTDSDPSGNRQRLITAGLPIALIVGFCLFAFAQRAIQGFAETHTAQRANLVTRGDARYIAGTLCEDLTGSKTEQIEASQQSAFSIRRNKTIQEWEVTCDTQAGAQYLIRINAATSGVYSINRISDSTKSLAIARPAQAPTEENALPIIQAQALASRYLRTCGVPLETLTSVAQEGPLTPEELLQAEGYPPSNVYCFSYQRYIPGIGHRMLKVGVNRYSGELEFIWNPVAAL